jgi:TIR domain
MVDDLQVFVSYARKDNECPKDDPNLKGFVTFLHESLIDELNDLGVANVKVWRDTRNISDVDQFAPILEKQIINSSIMVVVMSPNWLASPYCQTELKRFAHRWAGEGEEIVKTRIKVIRKRPNERDQWPPLLQGQVGISFFSDDQSDDVALEEGYFWRGKVRDETYHKKVRELAGVLSREASRGYKHIPQVVTQFVNVSSPKKSNEGRTIFVAKPGTDMKAPYNRVVHELTGRGYSVVPEQDIPLDETAIPFIDAALEGSDLSVHLLGESRLYTTGRLADRKIAARTRGKARKGRRNAAVGSRCFS